MKTCLKLVQKFEIFVSFGLLMDLLWRGCTLSFWPFHIMSMTLGKLFTLVLLTPQQYNLALAK